MLRYIDLIFRLTSWTSLNFSLEYPKEWLNVIHLHLNDGFWSSSYVMLRLLLVKKENRLAGESPVTFFTSVDDFCEKITSG